MLHALGAILRAALLPHPAAHLPRVSVGGNGDAEAQCSHSVRCEFVRLFHGRILHKS